MATVVICQQWKDNTLAFSLFTPREVLTNRNLSSFCCYVKTVEALVLYCFPWPYICLYDVYYWLKWVKESKNVCGVELRQHKMTVGSEVAGDNEERRKRWKWPPGDLKSGLTISLLPLLLTAVSDAHKASIRFSLCLRHTFLPVEPSTLSAPFYLMAALSPLLLLSP